MNAGRIFKAKQSKRFTVIPNDVLEDKELSLKAIGLLCFLLKLPEDWNVHKSRLHTMVKDGRDSVMSAFEELQDRGYVRVEKVRNEKKQFLGYNYFIFSERNAENQNTGFQETAKKEDKKKVKPTTGKPVSEKADIQRTDSTKDILTKKNTDTPDGVSPEKTEYQKFIDIYDQWHKKREGVPPKIDGAAGNAAKSLIGYLKSIVRARIEKEKKPIVEETVSQLMLDSWNTVLGKWELLEPFYQSKIRLIDINSNIQNIIKQIKDGYTKGNGKNGIGRQNAGSATFQAQGSGGY